MKRCLLSLLASLSFFLSVAQETVAEYRGENLFPIAFEGFADNQGNAGIHYIKRTGLNSAEDNVKGYSSCFVFPTKNAGRPIELPSAFTIQAVGYTATHFTLCLMKRNNLRKVPQSKVTLLMTDKGAKTQFRSAEIDLEGEKNPVFFDHNGIIYSISYVKKAKVIRVRRIEGLTIQEFDSPTKANENEVLNDHLAISANDRESDYVPAYVSSRGFVTNDKLTITYLKTGKERFLGVLEVGLASASLAVYRVDYSPTSKTRCFPMDGHLLIYEPAERSAEIVIWDIDARQVIRKLSTTDEPSFVSGDCFLATGIGRTLESVVKCNEEEKLAIFSAGVPWVQTWQTPTRALRLTYGNYTWVSEEIDKYRYLSVCVDPRTFEVVEDPGPSQETIFKNFAYVERKGKMGEYFLYFAAGHTYLFGFDNKTDTFTVWK